MNPTAVLFFSLVLDLIAFAIFLPLQPKLLLHYVEQDTSSESLLGTSLHAVAWWKNVSNAVSASNSRMDIILLGGIIGSVFSLLQFLTAPLYGFLADKFGRRPLLLLSAVGTVVAYATWVKAANFELFMISRIILGLFKFNVNIWSSVAADISTPQNRSSQMLVFGITFSIGFTVGPMIGAWLLLGDVPSGLEFLTQGNPYAFPSLVATVLAVVDVVFLVCCFKETLPQKSGEEKKERLALSINPFSMLYIAPQGNTDYAVVKKLTMVHLLFLIAFSGIEYTLGFLTWDRFGFTHKDLGRMYLCIGLVMALTSGGYMRRMKAKAEKQNTKSQVRKSIQKLILQGMVVLIPGWLVLAFSNSIWAFYVGVVAMGFSSGIVVSCIQALISTYGTIDQQGLLLGYIRSYGALGRAIGPFVFCALYWQLGSITCHAIAAGFLLLPIMMLMKLPLNI